MIEERFVNSGELERGVFDPFYGQYLEDRIRSKILQSVTETPVPTDAEIEFSIYDEDNTLRYWDRSEDYTVENDAFSLDVLSDIQESEIPNGSGYRLRYGFFKEELGSFGGNQKLYIQSFSDDRTEARVKPVPGRSNPFLQSFFDFFSEQNVEPFKFAVNFGENQYYRILGWSAIAKTDRNGDVVIESGEPQYKEAAVIRFESELPDGVSVGDEFWIDREVSRPYFDKFEIFRAAEPEPVNELAPPNFNVDVDKPENDSTFETLDDITTDMGQVVEGGFQTSETFIESRFDSSIDLNVDFTDFENFIHFSSAEERIRNFRFKIRQLQQFVQDIQSLESSAGTAGQIETTTRQMESLIGSFDRYERWLFRSDSEMAYPKKPNGSLYEADSFDAQEWFDDMIEAARRFDDRNESALRKQIPEFVKENPDNEDFVLFVDLVAHWFDLNWLYIDHLEYLSDSKESAFEPESLSADLSRVVAESMGLETFNGFDAEEFFDKIFDSENIDEIFDSKPVEQSTTPEVKEVKGTDINRVDLSRFQAQQQVWRRLLSNLVQYYKSRGTENSIRMLGNIFGVPTGSLVVREYGGAPEDTDANEVLEDTTHYASFVSSQQISFPWQTGGQITSQPSSFDEVFDIFEEYPKAAEFRFRTEYQGGVPLKVFELTNVLEVRVERTGLEGNMGKFIMQIQEADGTVVEVETGEYPIFNGEWISVLLQVRESGPYIDLFVQERSPVGNIGQFDQVSANVQLQTISNFFTAPSLLFGGNEQSNRFETGVSFIGDLDQINIWQRTISDRRYNLHTLAPRRIDVDNEILASGDTNFDLERNFLRRNLIYRSDFRVDQDLGQNPILQNESEKEETESLQAQAFGYGSFDGITKYDRKNFFSPVQVGATSFFSTKIRIEDTEVSAPLEAGESVEQRPQNLISKDSKRLGVFFSPYTSANREIFSEIGVEEINDLLGNPRDQHRDKYYSLEGVNRMYWNKYETPVSIQEYVRYIDKFYNAIFDHVRKSVPARVTLIDGIVLEPTILERDREPIPTGNVTNESLSTSVDVGPEVRTEIKNEVEVTASLLQSEEQIGIISPNNNN